jgi:hypothetical protein
MSPPRNDQMRVGTRISSRTSRDRKAAPYKLKPIAMSVAYGRMKDARGNFMTVSDL